MLRKPVNFIQQDENVQFFAVELVIISNRGEKSPTILSYNGGFCMIKTINLTGAEVKITELGGDNTEIINNSNGVVYASKLPDITIGGDEVIAIPAGAIDGLYGTHGTVYLLGTGSVELRGVDHKITESRSQSAEGGLGVVRDYIDSKDDEVLEIAKTYADVKDSEVLVNVKEYADSLNAELAGYIGYTDSDIYGLEADFENCVFTRLAGAVGKTAGADFDSVNAYGGRRRCNLSDSGEVLAYYGDDNFKADGSNGQVMVEQPKFYYRVVPLKTEKIDGADGYHLRKARYYISDTPKAGFKVHPAFVRNGVEIDRIYLSAFEGCIYDVSAGAYLLEDEQLADFNNDKLSSITGAKPCSGKTQQLTRTNARKLANNRGEGWKQATIQTVSATQLLFVVEYASFNSQNVIGAGAVHKKDDGSSNSAEISGMTATLGNSSGTVKNSENIEFVSYRGEENFWGNIWIWIDGVNEYNPETNEGGGFGTLFISEDAASGVYSDTGIRPVKGSGYISSFGYSKKYDFLFMPTECGGTSALPVGDALLNGNNGIMALMLGGASYSSYFAGAFYTDFNITEKMSVRIIGARLIYSRSG